MGRLTKRQSNKFPSQATSIKKIGLLKSDRQKRQELETEEIIKHCKNGNQVAQGVFSNTINNPNWLGVELGYLVSRHGDLLDKNLID